MAVNRHFQASCPKSVVRVERTDCVDVPHGGYEGRSINKLQNGAIPLILKIGKIENNTFCREFNFEDTQNFF